MNFQAKALSGLLAVAAAASLTACGTATAETNPGKRTVTLVGELSNARPNLQQDSVRLYDIIGQEASVIAAAPVKVEGSVLKFNMTVDVPGPGIYTLVVGNDSENNLNVALGHSDKVEVKSDLANLQQQASFPQDEMNTNLRSFAREFSTIQSEMGRISQMRQFSGGDPVALANAERQIDSLTDVQNKLAKTYQAKPGIVGKMAGVYTFVPFNKLPAGHDYTNQQDYVLRGFFTDAELNDPLMGYVPAFYEKAAVYVQVAIQSLPSDSAVKVLERLADRTPANSRTERAILAAVLDVSQAVQEEQLFLAFADRYVQRFPGTQAAQEYAEAVKASKNTAVGGMAPEIELPAPDGKTIKLSSLRGKYVLIDFWASWCGPCRAENPNVVRVYNQYKAKGFEIYGVSLDRDRASWLEAIKKDGLTWVHVSDLQYWQSAGAAAYRVKAIPYTVLVSPEGKIIAKNLRGPALEAKLAQLLAGK